MCARQWAKRSALIESPSKKPYTLRGIRTSGRFLSQKTGTKVRKNPIRMDHNKLIKAAAKKALKPLGLRQQGNSRAWYDDHGWWAIVAEFQPSSWSAGSYLNVAVSWMFYEHHYWSYDIGGRVEGFRSAAGKLDFESAANDLAAQAVRHVLEFRERYRNLDEMYAHYRSTIEHRGSWPDYYAGILAGLRNDWKTAESHFQLVVNASAATTWHRALQYRCRDLIYLLNEPARFRDSVLGIVLRCRASRSLGEMPVDELGFP